MSLEPATNKGNIIGSQFSFANACWMEPDNPQFLYVLAETINENTQSDGTRGGIYLRTAQLLLGQALEINPYYAKAAGFMGALEITH